MFSTSDRNKTVMTSSQIAIGDVITTLTASDPDTGYYGEVRYRILDQNHYQLFEIDRNTGEFMMPIT